MTDAELPPVLLDTGVYNHLQLGSAEWVDLLRGREFVLSFVTVGEILYGRHKASWGPERIAEQVRSLHAFRTIAGTVEVAQQYGVIARYFVGQTPVNDLWMAACALAVPLPLATTDRAHFEPIRERLGLEVISL